MIQLVSPLNGRSLTPVDDDLLDDGEVLWPVVEGIPFLRLGRDRLRRDAVEAINEGRKDDALVLLLQDQDDFSPTEPPSRRAVEGLLADDQATFRSAMIVPRSSRCRFISTIPERRSRASRLRRAGSADCT